MNTLMEFDRPIYNLAKKFFNDDFNYLPFFGTREHTGLSNISENEKEYLIEISTPGLKKEDIKIELDNDILKIYSDVKNEKEEKNENYYRKEFCRSSFERNFTLPKIANKDEISATMENGVLSVTIPKMKAEKKKDNIKISIK
jgi:HSP20 family protein